MRLGQSGDKGGDDGRIKGRNVGCDLGGEETPDISLWDVLRRFNWMGGSGPERDFLHVLFVCDFGNAGIEGVIVGTTLGAALGDFFCPDHSICECLVG